MSKKLERCLDLINMPGKVLFTLTSFEIKPEGQDTIQGDTDLKIIVDEMAKFHRSDSQDLSVYMNAFNGEVALKPAGSDEEYFVPFLSFVRMLN